MRDVKIREENKKKADARRAQKMEEEAKVRDKAARARAGDMEQKQFAFDSEGNVLWVQPVAPERLPAPVTLPSYKFSGKDNIPPDPMSSGSTMQVRRPHDSKPK